MTKTRRTGLLVMLVCGCISIWWGCALGWSMPGGPLDFQAVYYGSKTLIQHHDPYRISDVEEVFRAEGRETPAVTTKQRTLITLFVNTPATLLLVAPFAMLPLAVAQIIWLILVSGSLLLAAYLIWDLTVDSAPFLSTCLVGFLLLNCQVVFAAGNTAAIVVGFCTIATWCFIRDRFVYFGIVCMALSLLIKPHDSGMVWLYFLLANGVQRRRAMQTAALGLLFAIPALVWIWNVVPGWWQDWQMNLAIISAPGGMNDPRPGIVGGVSAGNVISLQAVFSVFNESTRFYNLASYMACGIPIIFWVRATVISRYSPQRAWLAIATIVPFNLLVTYHRVYDAKLLLLTIPACLMQWAICKRAGRIVLLVTSAAILLNADVPLAILNNLTNNLHLSAATLSGKFVTVTLARPNQLVLLAEGVVFLWIYVWSDRHNELASKQELPPATST